MISTASITQKELVHSGEMVPVDAAAGQIAMSKSRDSGAGLATTPVRNDGSGLGIHRLVHCAMLPEDEKLLSQAHDIDVEQGPLSSAGTQEVFPSSEDDSENASLTTSSDPTEQNLGLTTDMEKRHVSFAQDEVNTGVSEEGIRPGQEQNNASSLLELDSKEDEYLNDAVHRPVVHHRSSHVPAWTDQRFGDDGRILSETRSTGF